MDARLISHWFDIIRPLFPEHAQFDFPHGGAADTVSVNWNLNSDQNRPNKRSKSIKVVFATEAIDDYLASADALKSKADDRLQHHIAARIANFNPEHNVPAGQIPPDETWVIASGILNG